MGNDYNSGGINTRPSHIEQALVGMHYGQWFGWINKDQPDFKVYANLIVHPKLFDSATQSMVDNPHSKPTEEEVNAKLAELQAEWDATDYRRKRADEYPNIGNQLDKIYHDGIDAWKEEMITPVKTKYPKP